jgi:hypothetical protein
MAKPHQATSTGAWTAVWVAGVLLSLVVGVLLTRPVWPPRGRARAGVAVAVLSLQTGAVAVTGAVLTGVAVRSWQLLDRPPDAPPVVALVRLSGVDGDTALLAALIVLLIVGTIHVPVLSALAARFAAGDDRWERSLASALLALEVGATGYAAGRLLLGARGWPFLGPTVALPLLAAAFVACWPNRRPGRSVG